MKEKYAAAPEDLATSVDTQQAKVRRYMETWNSQYLDPSEIEFLWKKAQISLLLLRCAMNTTLFPNTFLCKEVVVLSTKKTKNPALLYACSKCAIGRLVSEMRVQIVEPLRELQLDIEEVVKLEEYIFLTPQTEQTSEHSHSHNLSQCNTCCISTCSSTGGTKQDHMQTRSNYEVLGW